MADANGQAAAPSTPPPAGTSEVHSAPETTDDFWGPDDTAGEERAAKFVEEYDFDDPAYSGTGNKSTTRESPASKPAVTAPEPEPESPGDELVEDNDQRKARQPAAQPFSTEQLLRAAKLGLTAQELKEIGSPGALDAVLRREEGLIQAIQQRQQAQQQPPSPFDLLAQAIKPENLLTKRDRAELIEKGFDEAQIDLFEGYLGDMAGKFSNAMTPLVKHVGLMDQALRQAQQQAEYDKNQRAVDEWMQDFNRMCDDVPEQWKAQLADPANRQMLLQECGILAGEHQRQGRPIGNKQLFDKALRVAFYEQVESVVRDQVREDVDRRQSRATARAKPGGPRQTPDADERAVRFAETFRSKNGMRP